jgi:hypothetical protein
MKMASLSTPHATRAAITDNWTSSNVTSSSTTSTSPTTSSSIVSLCVIMTLCHLIGYVVPLCCGQCRMTDVSSSPDLAAPHMPPPPSSRTQSKATKVPDHDTVATDDSNMIQSAFKLNLNVATHDGTQRITIRWTPGNKDLLHTQNPGEWMKAALTIIIDRLPNECGVLY